MFEIKNILHTLARMIRDFTLKKSHLKKKYYIELTDETLKKKISELGTRENHTNSKYK